MEKELAFPQFVPLHIGYAELDGNWHYEQVNSPFFRIYLVMQGEGHIKMGGRRLRLTPHHLYLIPPHCMHSTYADGKFCHYYVHVFETMLDRRYSVFERFTFPLEVESSELDEDLLARLVAINAGRELVNHDPHKYDNERTLMQMILQNDIADYAWFIETRGILLKLFSRFLHGAVVTQSANDSRILQAMRYVREHVEREISVKGLANLACVDKDHFVRLFRREVGMTPLSYIQQKKVEEAQLMLIFKCMTVEDVAYHVSYTNVSYFISIFKRKMGMTPLEYKRMNHELLTCWTTASDMSPTSTCYTTRQLAADN